MDAAQDWQAAACTALQGAAKELEALGADLPRDNATRIDTSGPELEVNLVLVDHVAPLEARMEEVRRALLQAPPEVTLQPPLR